MSSTLVCDCAIHTIVFFGEFWLTSAASRQNSIRTVILEELILQNLREIVSFARSHENRFVQMVMDMDVKERNKGLAKKRKLLSEGEKRITELDMIFKRLYEDNSY